jgi:peptidoglycan/LPS O-acetylase OafA/YrhL
MNGNHLTIEQKLLPGVFALLFLFIYYTIKATPDTFFSWLEETLIVYAAWFFLLGAAIHMIIERDFQQKNMLTMCIGAIALIIYLIVFKTTPEELFVDLLEATVIYSVLITVYGTMKDRIHKKWYEK